MRIYGALIRTVKGPSPNHSNARLGHVGEGVRDVVVRVQEWQPIRVCPYKLEIPGDIKVNTGGILNQINHTHLPLRERLVP
jgi:hypothetical protein